MSVKYLGDTANASFLRAIVLYRCMGFCFLVFFLVFGAEPLPHHAMGMQECCNLQLVGLDIRLGGTPRPPPPGRAAAGGGGASWFG